MADVNDLTEDSTKSLSRRNVLIGTAWATPVVMGVGAAPAWALSLPWAIDAPSQYINIANASAFDVSGTGVPGQVVTLSVTGLSPTPTVTVGANGHWSITLNLSGSAVPQGTITFTPTTNPAHTFAPTSRTATKDTVAPAITIGNNPSGNSGAGC